MSIRSKTLCLGVPETTKQLADQNTAYALRNRQGNQAFAKENEKKNICIKEICKIVEIHGWIFFPTNDFSLLESCQLYIIAKYKTSNCCKIEATIQRCSVKKIFFKILQNSQENRCARVSFLIKLQAYLFHRTRPMAVSGKFRLKSLKSAKFQFQLFLTTFDIMGSLYIVTK